MGGKTVGRVTSFENFLFFGAFGGGPPEPPGPLDIVHPNHPLVTRLRGHTLQHHKVLLFSILLMLCIFYTVEALLLCVCYTVDAINIMQQNKNTEKSYLFMLFCSVVLYLVFC